MAYQMFDRFGAPIRHPDLQAKQSWCQRGENLEQAFVREYGEIIGVEINPEKSSDPYVADLVCDTGYGDLKGQFTPFFSANRLYNIDPRFAVVFNKKDRDRYQEKYPEIIIYYWIDWQAVSFEMGSSRIEIEPLMGVWKIPFQSLLEMLNPENLHVYQQRRQDIRGNAKESYVIDIRDPRFTCVFGG